MPASDRYHETVVHSLVNAGWTIIKEQYSLVIGQSGDDLRRLYVEIAAQSQTSQIVLIAVKTLENSPVHQFMTLVGQYLVYRTALNYLGNTTPLYVAISETDYQVIMAHPLWHEVLHQTLREPIPFVIYDPDREELLKWILLP